MHEAAREILRFGREQTTNFQEFEISIFNRQLEKENQLKTKDSEELLFLDRGIIDTVAYCQIYLGFIPKKISSQNQNLANRYNLIFVLDKLPFMHDGLRIEKGEAEAEKIHTEIIKTYAEYGYSIIKVPVMPIEKRADFILDYIQKRRLNKWSA